MDRQFGRDFGDLVSNVYRSLSENRNVFLFNGNNGEEVDDENYRLFLNNFEEELRNRLDGTDSSIVELRSYEDFINYRMGGRSSVFFFEGVLERDDLKRNGFKDPYTIELSDIYGSQQNTSDR